MVRMESHDGLHDGSHGIAWWIAWDRMMVRMGSLMDRMGSHDGSHASCIIRLLVHPVPIFMDGFYRFFHGGPSMTVFGGLLQRLPGGEVSMHDRLQVP